MTARRPDLAGTYEGGPGTGSPGDEIARAGGPGGLTVGHWRWRALNSG